MAAIELNASSLINDPHLKVYYRFENNLNDTSASGYTLSNSNSNDTASGKFGHGRSFLRSSSQYAFLTSYPNINLLGVQTWGMWVNPTAINVQYFAAGIRGASGGDFRGFFFNGAGGGAQVIEFDIDGLTTNQSVASSNAYNASAFNFLVGRYDGSQISIFLNGTWTKNTASGSGNAITSNFSIGRLGDQGVNYMDGVIDDFWIFDRALTDAEVKYLYDGTPISSPQGAFLMNFM